MLIKQKEESSAKVSELETARSRTSEELGAKNKEVMLLGKKVEELEQKLQKAEAVSKQKVSCFFILVLFELKIGYLPKHILQKK